MDEESTAVNDQVVADTTATESAPVENASSEVAEDEFDGLGDVDLANPSEVEAKKETEVEPAKEEDPVEKEAEAQPREEEKPLSPKAENRFQQLANDNRELRDQLERLKTQEAQLANEQDLINQINPETGDYYTPQEAERISFAKSREEQQQSIAEQRYGLEVQQSQQTLASEVGRVLQEFPQFNADSPDYNKEMAAQADQLLGASLVRDPNIPEIDSSTGQPTGKGLVIGSTISPYQLYSTIAGATKYGAAKGQASAQKATERMLANADTSSDAPHRGSADPMDDIFNRVKDFKFSG